MKGVVYAHINRHTATPEVVPRLPVLPDASDALTRMAPSRTLVPSFCISCYSSTLAVTSSASSRPLLKESNKTVSCQPLSRVVPVLRGSEPPT